MDKKIIDTLVKFGLITNIGIDTDSCSSIDDLINKGIVTIPGAKTKIEELIKDLEVETEEIVEPKEVKKTDEKEIVVDDKKDSEKTDEKEIVVDDKEDETLVEPTTAPVKNKVSKTTKTKTTEE